jgi:hypothetical protein
MTSLGGIEARALGFAIPWSRKLIWTMAASGHNLPPFPALVCLLSPGADMVREKSPLAKPRHIRGSANPAGHRPKTARHHGDHTRQQYLLCWSILYLSLPRFITQPVAQERAFRQLHVALLGELAAYLS